MSPEQFAHWLHGFVELTQGQTPNPSQWKSICEHLDLVFKKVTPSVGNSKIKVKVDIDTKDAQKAVDDLKRAYDDLSKSAKEISPLPNWWIPGYQPVSIATISGISSWHDHLRNRRIGTEQRYRHALLNPVSSAMRVVGLAGFGRLFTRSSADPASP